MLSPRRERRERGSIECPSDVNNIEDPQETEQETMGDKTRGNTGSDDVEDDDLEYTTDSDCDLENDCCADGGEYGKILMKFDNPEKYAALCKLVDEQECGQKTMGDKKRGNTGSDDVEDDDLEYTTDSDSDDDESEYGKILMKFDDPEKYAAFCKFVDETKAFDLTCFPHSWVGCGGSIIPKLLCKEYNEDTYNKMMGFALLALNSINDQTAYSKTAATTNGRTYKFVSLNKAAIVIPSVVVAMTVEEIVPDGSTDDAPKTETIVANVFPFYNSKEGQKVTDWMFYQVSGSTDVNDTRIFTPQIYEKKKKKRDGKRQNTQSQSIMEMEHQKRIRDKKRGKTEVDMEDDDLEYTTDSDSDREWNINIEPGIVRLSFSSPEAHAAYSKLVDKTKAFDLTCFPHSWVVGTGGHIFPELLCKEYDEATYNRMMTSALSALKSINDQTAYSKTAATTNGRTYKLVGINKAVVDSPNVVVVSMTVEEIGSTVDAPRTETIVAQVYPDYPAAKDKKVLDWMFYQGSSKDEMTDKNDTRIFVLAPYEEKKKKKSRHEKRQNTQSWSSTEMGHIEYSDDDDEMC
ncbi:seed storage albumin 5 [Striga asiatica]|uniref:Seed storage albumin 5 n=1 Tax=Striga asiatica TaxID=4170 RepID=A0A5A7QHL8_STRAF|nr:seed storage albumin 5 [Striga asiatica]